MPKYIRIKRGDTEYLDQHLLRDGELAATRNATIDGGPQHGESIKDFSLRLGEGETRGGVTPGGNLYNAALAFAVSVAVSALEEVEILKAMLGELPVTTAENVDDNVIYVDEVTGVLTKKLPS